MFLDYEKQPPKLLDFKQIKDVNGNLYVPKGLWQEIISHYSKEEVLVRLKDLIDSGEISFPYKEYLKLSVKEELNKLKNSTSYFYQDDWECNRLVQDVPFLYRGQSRYIPATARLGGKVSDLFTQEVRMEVGHQRFMSPMRAWTSKKSHFSTTSLTLICLRAT